MNPTAAVRFHRVTIISGQNISYFYDATGVKLRKTVNGIITDYAGNYIYENSSLQFAHTPEGYAEPINPTNYTSGFRYTYQYKDHLGNIRLSYTDINQNIGAIDLQIVEENNYYPFGLKHQGYNGGTNGNKHHKYMFGGKELQDDVVGSSSFEMYDFGARSYDPAIGRFTGIDPVLHHSMSPYNAFDNNPAFWADPSGGNSIYNFDTQQYVINGQIVTQEEAIAYAQNGGNADGSNNNTPDPPNPVEFFNYLLSLFNLGEYKVLDKMKAEKRGLEYQSTVSINPQREVKEWVIRNESELIYIADILETGGDVMALTGYVLTLTGEGAPIGVPLATAGTYFSATGSLIRGVTVSVSKSELNSLANESGYIAAGALVSFAASKIPGNQISKQILSQNASLKISLLETISDYNN